MQKGYNIREISNSVAPNSSEVSSNLLQVPLFRALTHSFLGVIMLVYLFSEAQFFRKQVLP